MITLFAIFGLFITVKASDIIEIRFQTVRCGDNVTIKCGEKDNKDQLIWYKQSFGKMPQYVVRKIKATHRFNDRFKDGRISITRDKNIFDIIITGIKEEDIATYFCAEMLENVVEFVSGTRLVFQEKANHQVPTLTVKSSGESVTLQCSEQAIASCCGDEQSVYWFKHGSGDSQAGIIYTHRDSSDQCNRSSEAGFPTQSCSYTLPKNSLGPADAGTFSCVVAACGKVIFGNGTKIDVKESKHGNIIVLTTCCTIPVAIIIVLVGVMLKNRKGSTNSHPSHTNQAEAENGLNYAVVHFAKKPSSFKRVKTDQDIYAQVKIH